MIYSVKGTVLNLVQTDSCFTIALELVSGLCLNLKISKFTANKLKGVGEKVSLKTQLIIRENSLELFGFETDSEKLIFNNLISVTGVGPNFAISILSTFEPDEIANLIVNENEKKLSSCKGIGKKIASRIILELKNKIQKLNFNLQHHEKFNEDYNNFNEAIQALLVLGYDKKAVEKAVHSQQIDFSVQQLIKNALKILSSN